MGPGGLHSETAHWDCTVRLHSETAHWDCTVGPHRETGEAGRLGETVDREETGKIPGRVMLCPGKGGRYSVNRLKKDHILKISGRKRRHL